MSGVVATHIENVERGFVGKLNESNAGLCGTFGANNGYTGVVLAFGRPSTFISKFPNQLSAVDYLVSISDSYATAYEKVAGDYPGIQLSFNNSINSATDAKDQGKLAGEIVLAWQKAINSNIGTAGPFLDLEYGSGFTTNATWTLDEISAYKSAIGTEPFPPLSDGTGNWACSDLQDITNAIGASNTYPQIYCVTADISEWKNCGISGLGGCTVTSDSGLTGCSITTAQGGIDAYKSTYSECPGLVFVYLAWQGSPQVSANSLSCL